MILNLVKMMEMIEKLSFNNNKKKNKSSLFVLMQAINLRLEPCNAKEEEVEEEESLSPKLLSVALAYINVITTAD